MMAGLDVCGKGEVSALRDPVGAKSHEKSIARDPATKRSAFRICDRCWVLVVAELKISSGCGRGDLDVETVVIEELCGIRLRSKYKTISTTFHDESST
jgi:hypothetical protein